MSYKDEDYKGYLLLTYSAYTTVDIDDIETELNISWNDVKEYYVKWDTLYLTMKNDDKHIFELNINPEVDIKYPDSISVEDKNNDNE